MQQLLLETLLPRGADYAVTESRLSASAAALRRAVILAAIAARSDEAALLPSSDLLIAADDLDVLCTLLPKGGVKAEVGGTTTHHRFKLSAALLGKLWVLAVLLQAILDTRIACRGATGHVG